MSDGQAAGELPDSCREFGPLTYSLRPAQAADAAAIEACVHAAYRHYIERIGRKPGPMLDDHAEVIQQRQVTKMAENLAGYAKFGYVEYDRRTGTGLARVFMRKKRS